MPLFTFVIDFRGGTYLSQNSAQNVSEASERFCEAIASDSAHPLHAQTRRSIAATLSEGSDWVELAGLNSVWCTSCVISDELALIHMIKTHS